MRTIEELDGAGLRANLDALAEVLHDCVRHGASVGFVFPFTLDDARGFWRELVPQIESGARKLLVARDAEGVVCATVQLGLAMPPNGRHRADVNKMLVHTRARRQGLAGMLLAAAEEHARALGRSLLVLDTWSCSPAEDLYRKQGYQLCGQIPQYALAAEGGLGATTVMYKLLAPALQVGEEDPSSDEARLLLDELSAALAGITGDSGASSFNVDDVRGAGGRFVVVRDAQGRALGCGAIRPLQDGVAELKRMYARPGTRGVGSAVLAHLEQAAADLGYRALWLETRLVNSRALGFYAARGYLRIPNFGKYAGNSAAVCMAKRLTGPE
ncbi:GNAT family N-acetyltransferase [Massilia sp. BJB1822]|uniref:GNAT family N-acetyltransferase n=1 Tax=Massilia sp. BJB1822 TaxID=2744470 RepID=UPI001594C71A|nr:GNAT family N-acetyltransferase [Massilia sp. BJB1822]NVD98511.1 GNAT family N-acetyltransferase [Massilia sp. BJB1822]